MTYDLGDGNYPACIRIFPNQTAALNELIQNTRGDQGLGKLVVHDITTQIFTEIFGRVAFFSVAAVTEDDEDPVVSIFTARSLGDTGGQVLVSHVYMPASEALDFAHAIVEASNAAKEQEELLLRHEEMVKSS